MYFYWRGTELEEKVLNLCPHIFTYYVYDFQCWHMHNEAIYMNPAHISSYVCVHVVNHTCVWCVTLSTIQFLFSGSNCCRHLSVVVSDITQTCLFTCAKEYAAFQTDHIGEAIAVASAFTCRRSPGERERRGPAAGTVGVCCEGWLCLTVSCRVCCCFAEGLWEVLALRGQLRTPPSSCFDRQPALKQTFCLFHCGPPICGILQKLQNSRSFWWMGLCL